MIKPAFYTEDIGYFEDLYKKWQKDHNSVDNQWHGYFSSIEILTEKPIQEKPQHDMVYKQSRVFSLIWAYRDVGYLYAKLNPLVGYLSPNLHYLYEQKGDFYERLTLREFDLSEEDLEREFSAGRYLKPRPVTLMEILEALAETYCSSIGVEFLHIQNKEIRRWLIKNMESVRNKPELGRKEKLIILKDLIKAEEFERFLHSQFIGQKRFSLEGAEVLIPALHFLVNQAVETGVQEIVLGTSHRGRLNILANILDKPVVEIFSEFEDSYIPDLYGGSGDVKYHRGYKKQHIHEDGKSIQINMVSNPSHLESVDPVVEGIARGIQTKIKDDERKMVIPIIIHGDASFSGQGVVSETFNLSQLRGYATGGTVHIIINNQIGFTTSTKDARSTFFPTDVAKSMQVPIFHVNGDDPESVIHAVNLSFNFRQEFGRDALVDIFCYRRHGHNEGDEPSFSHPRMYKLIKDHPSVSNIYGKKLHESSIMLLEEQERMRQQLKNKFKEILELERQSHRKDNEKILSEDKVKTVEITYIPKTIETGVDLEVLLKILEKTSSVPVDYKIHSKLLRIVKDREEKFRRNGIVDFALAEIFAFGSLLIEGIPVRLSGEDCARGTFSQRHAVWWDTESQSPRPYTPLNNLSEKQASFTVYDSPLSEFSVLGFEYGYSLAQPEGIVIWEAQFGDFSNGAQVVIDNYVASGESKWGETSSLVLFLPHGYEGQGPDHSSAHLERFLQLSAENNIQVCNVSTPAQYFHLLRRQVTQRFRKPLVLMTPKSLLRHPKVVSNVSEFKEGYFQESLDDPTLSEKPSVLLFCSGKIYYDLREEIQKKEIKNNALIRIEQLYPFPQEQIKTIINKYGSIKDIFWVQEEPYNRGAWGYIKDRFILHLGITSIKYLGRKESASPATGSHIIHELEQETLFKSAFKGKRELKVESKGKN